MKKIILLLLLAVISVELYSSEINIIPRPTTVEIQKGNFILNEECLVFYEKGLKKEAIYLQELFERSTGFTLKLKQGVGARRGDISLLYADKGDNIKSEGYLLDVSKEKVQIAGADNAGVFYGIQTLLQLFPDEIYSRELHKRITWIAPAVKISDAPSYSWRGMMLDVARYFYDKEFVKKYIDMMAMYKLNKLQFHFIDDSGWRLEIKKYPLLTEVGAWAGKDEKRIGGFYTQDDIREIVEYAAVRNVEVIPEIEFPAHMLAAIVAYPWLSCTEVQHEVPSQHFISRDLLCLGKQSSFEFLEDVLKETVDLFPSKYINIGGDEAIYDRWKACPLCQKVQKEQGLTDASQLQGYLTNVVSHMMKKYDKTIVGWEEIVQRGKLDNQVVGVIWRDLKYTKDATEHGHYAVLCPASHTYFDFPESKTPGEIKAAMWMPPISIEKCYSLDADKYNVGSMVLGVQGCFWSDQFIHGDILREFEVLNENRSENYAEYLTFPRLLALSEVGWSVGSSKNYDDFAQRLKYHYSKLDSKECHYRVPEPSVLSMKSVDGGVEFTLSESVAGSDIRYTTDGRYPHAHSELYTKPVLVDDSVNFRAITVVSGNQMSLPLYYAEDYSKYKAFGQFIAKWEPKIISDNLSKWRVEATGKIAGNGTYKINFIALGGTKSLEVESVKIFKREDKVGESNQLLKKNGAVASFTVDVTSFEAGTPFFIEAMVRGVGGVDTTGAMFIRKVQ